MRHEITKVGNATIIGITFIDEGADLTEHIQVDGDEKAALAYLPFFEKDMRRNYAHLFPQTKQIEGGTIE